jgi:hypothetical protein
MLAHIPTRHGYTASLLLSHTLEFCCHGTDTTQVSCSLARQGQSPRLCGWWVGLPQSRPNRLYEKHGPLGSFGDHWKIGLCCSAGWEIVGKRISYHTTPTLVSSALPLRHFYNLRLTELVNCLLTPWPDSERTSPQLYVNWGVRSLALCPAVPGSPMTSKHKSESSGSLFWLNMIMFHFPRAKKNHHRKYELTACWRGAGGES